MKAIIERLKEEIEYEIKQSPVNCDERNWFHEKGILISINEAKEIVYLLTLTQELHPNILLSDIREQKPPNKKGVFIYFFKMFL